MDNSQLKTKENIDDSQSASQPNPDGFFANLTESDACSVAVAVRVRPLVGRELTEGNRKLCIQQSESSDGNKLQLGAKSFNFDKIFWNEDSQEYIFDSCTKNLLLGCFHGFNATILAYGQTGSGKTHTMGTGSTIGVAFETVGIVPRVFKFIFEELDKRKAQSEYSEFKIRISFLEIYNEELHDLLDPASMIRDRVTGKAQKEITIREEKNGVISLRGLKEQEVSSDQECLHLLNAGINHRQTSSTLMNEGSSRSHAIFTVTIEQKIVKDVEEGAQKSQKTGDDPAQQITVEISSKFHFVDLAGSERIKKTGAIGQQLKEGISINKGLLCLGQVISALTADKGAKEHIPYRDSKLTRILQDSLGGNSRTTMIACVSPAESNYEESLSTIKYASRARNIKNKPVINRDPNSMLIESLRTQIKQLQFEVSEYIVFVTKSGIQIPQDLSEKFAEKQKKISIGQQQKIDQQTQLQTTQQQSSQHNDGSERELKIKLSHKDKEIKDLQQKLKDQLQVIEQRDQTIRELEKEKDHLALKSEFMADKLKNNNIEFDNKQYEAKAGVVQSQELTQKVALIDQYKAKISKYQKDLDSKIKELQDKDQKFQALKEASDRNEKILKKHIDENQALKRQLQSSGFVDNKNNYKNNNQQVKKEINDILPEKRDIKMMRAQRKEASVKLIEEFNQKQLDHLKGCIDQIFTDTVQRKLNLISQQNDTTNSASETFISEATTNEGEQSVIQEDENGDYQKRDLTPGEKQKSESEIIDEKQKFLNEVRMQALSMQADIKDLLKNEWAGSIQTLEGQKKKAENDRQLSIAQAKNDLKAISAIESEHQKKMDILNSQVQKLEKEKQKKEESVAKQIALQETRIKALETDLERQRKMKEEIEKAKKYDEDRFFKFKQAASKDLIQEKKKASDKEKQMLKVKNDLKKVEQLAQQKISQLKGLQKRALEEKQRREQLEAKSNETKGIDIDLIKEWITFNTEAMLKNQELKEYIEKQIQQKDKIENEMLEEGDRMTELLFQREKLEFEKEDLQSYQDNQKSEGRILEIEDQLNDINYEITSITETLDMLEETMEFVQQKVNQATEEIESFDIESIQQLSFNALESVESAKVTLQIFFQIVLDLNVYKRDLEQKCLEQDENVIQLTANLKSAEARVKYMIENGGTDGYAGQIAKQASINAALRQVDGYVDNRDVEHLNLNPAEQTNLTKLSLSKIVNNLKNKLKEQEIKNQSISLKLDQALKQKEIYKSRFDELKSQQKNVQFSQQPKSKAYQNVSSKLTSHEQQQQNQFGIQVHQTQKSLSFKDRQSQKKDENKSAVISKPVESLADRRKNRKTTLLDEDSVNELGSEIDKLKQTADDVEKNRGNVVLEEISEEEFEEEKEFNRRKMLREADLTTVNEIDEELGDSPDKSLLEIPKFKQDADLNYSYLSDKKIREQEKEALNEEWVLENFIDLTMEKDAKLVEFFILSNKMMCIFQNFQVYEIDLMTREIVKTYNLQEIEGFEISDAIEDDKVVSFALEKDVQLIGVACIDSVHILEYSEDQDIGLSYIVKIDKANISKIIFVQYILLMTQEIFEESSNQPELKIFCFDIGNNTIESEKSIQKSSQESKVIIEPGSDCIYYAVGSQIGKIEISSMAQIFQIQSGHSEAIIDINVVSQINQIITTSSDGSIRFFNTFNGQSIQLPMEEMDCDCLASQGIHLLTRMGSGSERTMVVWRFKQSGGVEENPVDEIQFTTEDQNLSDVALKFKMKGGVFVTSDDECGQDIEQLIMMFQLQDQVKFKIISQKLVKF